MGTVSLGRAARRPMPLTIGRRPRVPHRLNRDLATILPVRNPAARHGASPAVRFLRETLLRPADPAVAAKWAARLRSGGIVREIAAGSDLRRALPSTAAWLKEAGLFDDLPADEKALLAAARLAAKARAEAVLPTLDPLGWVCKNDGIAPLLLKGTALHGTLYADPASRPVSDVDVYLRPRDFAAFRRALLASGLQPDPLTAARITAWDATRGREGALSDFVFRRADRTGLPLEAKLDPVQVGLPLARAEQFLEGAAPSPLYEGFLVPAPEPMAVQQALHLARHDGSDIVWFAEVAEGVRRATARGAFDPQRALSLVAGEGLAGPVRAVFRAVEALFPGSIPDALVHGAGRTGWTPSRLREKKARCGPADERVATWSLQAAHAFSSGRPGAVLGALARRAKPHPAYLAARLGVEPGSQPAWMLNLRRLAALAAPKRRT